MDPDTIFKTPYAVKKEEIKRMIRGEDTSTSKIRRIDKMEGTKGGDDEDPRFYGSGVTPEYEELLDYVNEAEKEPATIDTSELKKRLNALQKLLSENTKLRTKYPNDPLKFADSEVELNEGIEKIIQIWDKDLYAQLLELDAASIISNLLTHENIDICLATVDLVDELLDEDVANTGEYKNLLEAKRFLESLLETGCMELLIQNLYRLDESNKTEDSTGIFRTMSIIENSMSISGEITDTLVNKTKLMNWLVDRTKGKLFDTNILYAVEILSILLLDRRSYRILFCSLDGVDNLLQIIGRYRKRDPETSDEVEFLQNAYNSLISCLREPEVKEVFLKLEGIELMIIALSNMKMSRISSIVALDAAFDGPIGLKICEDLCEEFIALGGLKYLFPALIPGYMKKYAKKYKKEFNSKKDTVSPTDMERVLRKFRENNYQKMTSLIDIYKSSLDAYDKLKLLLNKHDNNDDDNYETKLDIEEKLENCSAILTKLSFILGSVYYHSENIEGMKNDTLKIFEQDSVQLPKLRDIIKEYMDGLSATCVYDIKPGDETNSRAEDKKDSQTEDKTDPQVQPSENTINHDDIRTEIVEFEIKRLSRIMNMLVD